MQWLQCTLQWYETTSILRWSCSFYWILILLGFFTTDLNGVKILHLQLSIPEGIQFIPVQTGHLSELGISVSPHQTVFKTLYSLNAMRTRLFSNCISAWWVKCFNDFILLLSHSVHNKSERMPEQYLFWFTKAIHLTAGEMPIWGIWNKTYL